MINIDPELIKLIKHGIYMKRGKVDVDVSMVVELTNPSCTFSDSQLFVVQHSN